MTVKIKTFGSMGDANEWFKEGRPKRIAAVVVVQSADAELSRPSDSQAKTAEAGSRRTLSRDERWRNAVCDYAQVGMCGTNGSIVRQPPAATTFDLFMTLGPVWEGLRNRVPAAMAGALARIMVVHPRHVDKVSQFALVIREASLAAHYGNAVTIKTAWQWNVHSLTEFCWSLYDNPSVGKGERPKIIYCATADAFFNAMQGARIVKFLTSVPTSDCIVK